MADAALSIARRVLDGPGGDAAAADILQRVAESDADAAADPRLWAALGFLRRELGDHVAAADAYMQCAGLRVPGVADFGTPGGAGRVEMPRDSVDVHVIEDGIGAVERRRCKNFDRMRELREEGKALVDAAAAGSSGLPELVRGGSRRVVSMLGTLRLLRLQGANIVDSVASEKRLRDSTDQELQEAMRRSIDNVTSDSSTGPDSFSDDSEKHDSGPNSFGDDDSDNDADGNASARNNNKHGYGDRVDDDAEDAYDFESSVEDLNGSSGGTNGAGAVRLGHAAAGANFDEQLGEIDGVDLEATPDACDTNVYDGVSSPSRHFVGWRSESVKVRSLSEYSSFCSVPSQSSCGVSSYGATRHHAVRSAPRRHALGTRGKIPGGRATVAKLDGFPINSRWHSGTYLRPALFTASRITTAPGHNAAEGITETNVSQQGSSQPPRFHDDLASMHDVTSFAPDHYAGATSESSQDCGNDASRITDAGAVRSSSHRCPSISISSSSSPCASLPDLMSLSSDEGRNDANSPTSLPSPSSLRCCPGSSDVGTSRGVRSESVRERDGDLFSLAELQSDEDQGSMPSLCRDDSSMTNSGALSLPDLQSDNSSEGDWHSSDGYAPSRDGCPSEAGSMPPLTADSSDSADIWSLPRLLSEESDSMADAMSDHRSSVPDLTSESSSHRENGEASQARGRHVRSASVPTMISLMGIVQGVERENVIHSSGSATGDSLPDLDSDSSESDEAGVGSFGPTSDAARPVSMHRPLSMQRSRTPPPELMFGGRATDDLGVSGELATQIIAERLLSFWAEMGARPGTLERRPMWAAFATGLVSDEDEDELATRGLDKYEIEAIAPSESCVGDTSLEGITCVICTAGFDISGHDQVGSTDEMDATEVADASQVRRLPCSCSVVFHAFCIDQWLTRHATCPTCREDLDLNVPRSANSI